MERVSRSCQLRWSDALDAPPHRRPDGTRVNYMPAQFEVDDSQEAIEGSDAPSVLPGFVVESDFEFYQRRAMEEARSAQRASCPRAAAAHRYLSSVYSEKVRRELEATANFEDLLNRLS